VFIVEEDDTLVKDRRHPPIIEASGQQWIDF